MAEEVIQPIMPLACPACGKAMPDGAAFCPGCGRRIKPLKGGDSTMFTPRMDRPMSSSFNRKKEIGQHQIQSELPERYQFLRPLGRGGMGVVLLCQDTSLDRPVAIKLMAERYQADEQAERRFLREARAQANINHHGVARLMNVGVSPEGRPFLVMEYVAGRDLREIIHENTNGMDPLRACTLIGEACDGLAEAHAAGIVHRDIKPSNLMVLRDHRNQEHIKILDLGLAKILGGHTDLRTISVDTASHLVGTPAYMSPEQVTGASVDARADIYALGIVLYELLTGRLPFESESIEGWLYQHLHAVPPPPTRFRPELIRNTGLEELVLDALSKQPEQRPQTAMEFGQGLRRIIARMPQPQPKTPAMGMLMTVASNPAAEAAGASAGGVTVDAPRPPKREIPIELQTPPPTKRPPSRHNMHIPGVKNVNELIPRGLLQTQVVPNLNATSESPDPTLLRLQRYGALHHAASDAENNRQWELAVEKWQQALKFTEDVDTVNAKLLNARKEMEFEKILSNALLHAKEGDWLRAEGVLNSAASMKANDPRMDQTRAQIPPLLMEAWLNRVAGQQIAITDPRERNVLKQRLALGRASMGDMTNALKVLQEYTKDGEERTAGLAQNLIAAIKCGHREGLRPFIERALASAKNLPDPGARGRACLEVGKALTAYGDADAAAAALQSAAAGMLADASQSGHTPTSMFGANPPNPANNGSGTTAAIKPMESLTLTGRYPTTRRSGTNFSIKPKPESSREAGLSAVALAQAEAGLSAEAASTCGLLEDGWNRSQTLCRVAQALARAGRGPEAERIAAQIAFKMSKSQAFATLAIARIYGGDMARAQELLAEVANPEERVPVIAYFAAAFSRRGEKSNAVAKAQEALAAVAHCGAPAARLQTLLQAIEPLLQSGQPDLATPLLNQAAQLLDAVEVPAERLARCLQLAKLHQKARNTTGPRVGAAPLPASTCPPLLDALRRALSALRLIREAGLREEALYSLASALSASNAPELLGELQLQARTEFDRSLIWLGLTSGMS